MGRKTFMKVQTSPEIIEQINPKNMELMNDFLDYLKANQKSPKTINAYKVDLLCAFAWNLQYNDNKFFVDWTKRNFVKYQTYMIEELRNSPARIRRVKATLSSLSNYIENILDDEFPDFRNRVIKIESPVVEPVREKTILTEEQCQDMLDHFQSKGMIKQACAFALAMYSGRRKSELIQFRVDDFTPDRRKNGLYVTHPIRTKGRGERGKVMECYVWAKKFQPYYEAWMEEREKKGIDSIWLFPKTTNPDEHVEVKTFDTWAEYISKYLGVDFYWHCLRHYIVTYFKREGFPDSMIQEYIGWENMSMIPVYSDMKSEETLSMYFSDDTEDGMIKPKVKSLDDD